MKAAETNLRSLLEGGKQYSIPLFQRPYTWGRDNWETLWEDILIIYDQSPETNHFIGPMVTLALPGQPDGLSPFIVIDGQQRLTTFSIILAALRDHLEALNGKNNLAKELHDLYLINLFKEGDNRLKILPTKMDLETYKSIIFRKIISEKNLLREAYDFFKDRISEECLEGQVPLDPIALKRILLQQLTLVHITVDEKDNPYLIFESLNHKGTPLTQADLVRNSFFMRLPRERHEEIYNEIWLPVQQRFSKCGEKEYLEELTNAFWYYLRKDGQRTTVVYNQVYQDIKVRIDRDGVNLEGLLQELLRFAEYYRRFRFPEVEAEPRLQRWFYRFKRLDFTTSYPFLLNLYDKYDQKLLSLDDFEAMLSLVESYFIRRLFVGISTSALNKVFNIMYRQIDIDEPVESLKMTLHGYSGNQIWPEDEQFRESIIYKSIYSSNRADRVKLILESLEEALTKENVDPKKLTIEHILPQKLSEEWCIALGEKTKEKHEKWVHTLGNLTLTAYNSELNNKPFLEKLKYLSESNISLNKYFHNLDKWNVEAIEDRGVQLAEIAVKVWPR
jgi:uncharacterized protein with ParB-like and HNH nuclease domain